MGKLGHPLSSNCTIQHLAQQGIWTPAVRSVGYGNVHDTKYVLLTHNHMLFVQQSNPYHIEDLIDSSLGLLSLFQADFPQGETTFVVSDIEQKVETKPTQEYLTQIAQRVHS